ncbi:MAG TPA: choice-of-anchor R domain-containing protein [Chloroflexia bacterium]
MRSIWNSRFIRTCLAVIPLLVIPLVISMGMTPGARNISAFAASPSVLHDQLNNFEGTVVSFENGSTFSSQAADDFVVPAGKTWTLSQVDVAGFPVVGSAQPSFFNVLLYRDNSTLPGVQVASYSNLSYVINPTNGEYSIAFPSTLFGPGTYWVSVQADTTAAGNRWTWSARLLPALNNGGAWRNPGNGFGSGCIDWARKTTCLPQSNSGPDQTFRLHGVEADAPTATPTSPPTATATPVRGVPPGFEPHYACRSTKDGALRDTGVLVAVGPRPTCLAKEVLVAILVNDNP